MHRPTGAPAGEPRERDRPDDPLDPAVELAHLLSTLELDELVASFARAHRCGVAIVDRHGDLLAAADLSGSDGGRAAIVHHGETLGWVLIDGGQPELARHVVDVLDVILHHALARRMTGAAHEAVVSHTFAELTQKNKSLEAAVQRLRDADRVKSNFLATMSHELRTPLTSVIGYSEMLLEGLAGQLTDEQREYVATILGKADQLLQLITAVLDMSRAEGHRPPMDPTPVALPDVVDSVVASFAPQARKRGITVEAAIEHQLRAQGDRRQIRQVLWNLVSNAVKFTPDGGHVVVALRLGPLVPGGVGTRPDSRLGAHLEVVDDGIGISRDQLPHIFEPFFQVDSSSTREYGGSGLGLALAKAYVEAHGGRIWVDSTPGRGSTFVASFPVPGEDVRAALEQGAPTTPEKSPR
ncbi:MAG TPA: HAMP domain-containing sensor histidine kinase [Kofleriaceae bacterium]|jgi:signal transduction histidine kinase|nr:HAMP domain-containing sensor histidine kinase [Kofleriaceae bacterium]